MDANVLFRIIGGDVTTMFEMTLSDTVLNLKESIEVYLKVEVIRQTLLFNSEELMNERTIESYQFQQFTTLNLVVAPMPGQPKFNIVVRSPTMLRNIRVRETYTVDQLKKKIEKHGGPLSKKITLICHFREMKDHLPLSAYLVCEGAEVEMSINMRP